MSRPSLQPGTHGKFSVAGTRPALRSRGEFVAHARVRPADGGKVQLVRRFGATKDEALDALRTAIEERIGETTEQPTALVNAEVALHTANAVLAVDLSNVPLTRVTQFIVGWCRAAFAQSRVIAHLTLNGMSSAAGPNRRLFSELAIRLQWLRDLPRDVRPSAVDEILEMARESKRGTHKHLRDMGWDVGFDPTEMDAFVLSSAEGALKDQARKFASAAHATEVKNGPVFAMWREDSYLAHPTGPLAGDYAPAIDDEVLGSGEPLELDPDLTGHRDISLLIIATTGALLTDEGVESEAVERMTSAFFSV